MAIALGEEQIEGGVTYIGVLDDPNDPTSKVIARRKTDTSSSQTDQDAKIVDLQELASKTVNQSVNESQAEMEAAGLRMTAAGVTALKAWAASVSPTAEIDAVWNAGESTLDFTDGTTTEKVATEVSSIDQELPGTAAHLASKDEEARPWTAKTLVEWIDGRVASVAKADGEKPDAGRFNIYPAGATPDYTGATANTYAKVVIGTIEQTVIASGGEYVSVTPVAGENVTQSGRLWDDDISYVPVDSFYFTAINSTDVSANGVTTVAGQTYVGSYVAARDAADTPDPLTATAAEITAEVALMNLTTLSGTVIDPAVAEAAVDTALAARGVLLPPLNLTPFTRSGLWATENAEIIIPISEGATVKDVSFQLGDRSQSIFDGGRQLPRETFTRQQMLVDGFGGTGWAPFSTTDYNGRDRWARNYRDHVFNVNYRWFVDAILENNTLILNMQSSVSGQLNRWAGYKDLVVTFEAI